MDVITRSDIKEFIMRDGDTRDPCHNPQMRALYSLLASVPYFVNYLTGCVILRITNIILGAYGGGLDFNLCRISDEIKPDL